jgi:hypothetical protein
MAKNNSTTADPSANPDPSGGQSDDQVGAANQIAGRAGSNQGAGDNGNGAPSPGSPDALAADEAQRLALAEVRAKGVKEIDPKIAERMPTPDLDKSPVVGGITRRADGSLQNANGMDIDETGAILDTPANRDRDPVFFRLR